MEKAPTTVAELKAAIQRRVDEIVSIAENFGEDFANVEVSTNSTYTISDNDWSSSWESSDASC